MITFPQTLMLLGSGELGKEFAIAAKRLGCNVIACDRYENAPAMQVSDICEVFNMCNPQELKTKILKHKPDLIIPEIEALAVDALQEIEKNGIVVIPNARATSITMNRDRIRNLANKELNLKTAKFAYAENLKELEEQSIHLGFPLLIKPVMSSSGKGQSLVKKKEDLNKAWEYAISGSRGESKKIIIEEFINFDSEITLLTIRQKDGSIIFCPPIGHYQSNGDYQSSWQPANINKESLEEAEKMASIVVNNLGGIGLFGVEFFIKNNEVIFSELSPRPHDTGLVTLISQNINEFELHLRAILGIPIPNIIVEKPGASRVILSDNDYTNIGYLGINNALSTQDTKLLIFGKQNARKGRRMGVALALGGNIEEANLLANQTADCIKMIQQ